MTSNLPFRNCATFSQAYIHLQTCLWYIFNAWPCSWVQNWLQAHAYVSAVDNCRYGPIWDGSFCPPTQTLNQRNCGSRILKVDMFFVWSMCFRVSSIITCMSIYWILLIMYRHWTLWLNSMICNELTVQLWSVKEEE